MRNFIRLAIGVLMFTTAAYAVPYLYVQSTAVFSPTTAGNRTVSVRIHLHNTGDIAASCVVKLGGMKKITGVSASGDAYVWFDGVANYKGFTVACSAG